MSALLKSFPAEGFMSPILESADVPVVSPVRLDARLVMGWRHFGQRFFRYNFVFHNGLLCGVVALRLRLDDFEFSKSQRRVLRRNADLKTRIVPAEHCASYDALFEKHKERFTENVPDSLMDFLSDRPSEVPCANMAVEVWLESELVAVSFMDVGAESCSSVYGMFDPEHGARSLGTLTLLLEIAEAKQLGKRFHYLGYAYTVPSVLDYKKRFHGVEVYDWDRRWKPLPEDFSWSRAVDVTEDPL
jgi:arginine-tRNA-protein transferase